MAHRRMWWIAGGVGVTTLATAVVLLLGALWGAHDPCAGVEAPADAVWNDTQRAAVGAGLWLAAPPVIAALDDRTARWKASRRDACEAARVRVDQDELVLRTRDLCLDRSLIDQRAAIRVLSGTADLLLASHAREVAAGGLDPDDCSPAKISASAPGVVVATNEAVYGEIAMIRALHDGGRFREVIALESGLEARVVSTNEPTLIAEWFLLVGRMHVSIGDPAGAREPLRRAADASVRARNDLYIAHAQADLAAAMAIGGELESVDAVIASAQDAATRSGSAEAEIWIDQARARIAMERGELSEALAVCNRTIERGERGGLAQYVNQGRACAVDVELKREDFAAAVTTGTRLLEAHTRQWGPDHPATLDSVRSLAIATDGLGNRAAAKPLWERVIHDTERSYGPHSIETMNILYDFAIGQSPDGATSTPEAGAAIARAVAIADKLLANGDAQRAAIIEAQAYVEGALGHHLAANDAWRRAIAAYEQLDDAMDLARTVYNAADQLKSEGRCDQAIPMFRRAAFVARSTGHKSVMQAMSVGAIGACLGSAKQWAQAEAALGSAIAQLDALGSIVFAAQNRWELGEQLVKRGQRARGIAIARAAAGTLTGQPPPADELEKLIVDWIAKH